MMELDVKLAPQCMEVGSAGLHTAAAAIQCRRGCQDLDTGASVFGRYLEVVSDDFADQKWKESEEKATLKSESRKGIFLNLHS